MTAIQTPPRATAGRGAGKTQTYAASVQLELTGPLTEDLLSAVADRLAGVHGAAGGRPGHPGGWLSMTFDVDAARIEQAAVDALALARGIAREAGAPTAAVHGLEVLTVAEQERRLATPLLPELMGLAEVAGTLGVSKQRVGQLRERADFPRPAAELGSGPVWTATSLTQFVAGWTRKPGRPARVAATTPERTDMPHPSATTSTGGGR